MVVKRKARDNMKRRPSKAAVKTRALAAKLLRWYDRSRRDLPWRAKNGAAPDPYGVWLSEVMLQQTTVAAVGPYFRRFLARWPDVHALGRAALDDVLGEWQGLGYYARARNLHACAKAVSAADGRFPDDEAGLRALPGIGPYTAAAIAAIAFGRRAAAVDGNVERVMARLFAVAEPLPGAKPRLRELAASLVPESRAGDYAQAVMDLGATVCTPRAPDCPGCPWRNACAAYAKGIAAELPRRAAKPIRPLRRGVAFFLTRGDGAIWLRRRPEKGLLGGMMELPSTPWQESAWTQAEAASHAPVRGRWSALPGIVEHGFTHFRLELTILAGKANGRGPAGGLWVRPKELGRAALPTVMKKAIRHALIRGRKDAATGTAKRGGKKNSARRGLSGGRDIVRGGIS
jgi:A/G-specific adenine glycosylase